MNEVPTKTCPLCCEIINAKARKCPHCQHFQNKWTLIAYHPLVAVIPMMLGIGAFGVFMNRLFAPGENFEAHRAQIQVVQSAMEFGARAASQSAPPGPTVAVVGTIRNDSGITWKEVIIGAEFFDKDHKLIDARQERDYGLVAAPGQPCAFKVSMPREFSADKYVSCEVNVVSAREARGIFQ